MKHFKTLIQDIGFTVANYAVYGAALFYKFPPALNFLPFYLVFQIVFFFLVTAILVIGVKRSLEKPWQSNTYSDYHKSYGWLKNTKSVFSILWSFAFASQAMYGIATGIILARAASCLFKVIFLGEEEKN